MNRSIRCVKGRASTYNKRQDVVLGQEVEINFSPDETEKDEQDPAFGRFNINKLFEIGNYFSAFGRIRLLSLLLFSRIK